MYNFQNWYSFALFYIPPSHEHSRQPSLASFTRRHPSSQMGAAVEQTFCVSTKETRENWRDNRYFNSILKFLSLYVVNYWIYSYLASRSIGICLASSFAILLGWKSVKNISIYLLDIFIHWYRCTCILLYKNIEFTTLLLSKRREKQ